MTPESKHLTFAATLKAADDGAGRFVGLASTFDNIDEVGDAIAPGAFAATLRKRPASQIRLLWQHDSREPIGTFSVVEETEKGLRVEGQLLIDQSVPVADKAHALMRAGALDSLSIGFQIPDGGSEFDRETGVRTLKRIDLLEISVVTFPANPRARIQSVKAMMAAGDIPLRSDLEHALVKQLGFSHRKAKALLSGGYAALAPEAAAAEAFADALDSLIAQMKGACQ